MKKFLPIIIGLTLLASTTHATSFPETFSNWQQPPTFIQKVAHSITNLLCKVGIDRFCTLGAFPSTLSSFTSGDRITSAWANALESKIGINNSVDTSSLDYKASHALSSLDGVSTGTQTLSAVNDTNVTLSIGSSTSNHSFTLGWTGQLPPNRGGLGSDFSSASGVLKFNSGTATTTAPAITGQIFMGNSTSAVWGNLVAGTNVTLTTSTPGQITINAAGSSSTLSVSAGGTGTSTLTANNVILGNGTSSVAFVAPGTSGNLLTSNGTTWQSAAPTVTGFSSRIHVIRNSSQSISNSSTTKVDYDTEDYDNLNEFDTTNDIFTASSTGYYQINAGARFGAGGTGVYEIDIYKNGSIFARGGTIGGNSGGVAGLTVSDLLSLSAGDTVQIDVYQNSGGSLNLIGGFDAQYLSIYRVQ